ncbi:MAG: M28 family peptidase [Lentisphaeria bacterium]|nr:M28 family peptidase [Lentisphaeria bacterium]
MDTHSLNCLFDLLKCHATPGDEDEVASLLLNAWKAAGWKTQSLGRYAVTAVREPDGDSTDAQTVLICAHMDSPGFIVQSINDDSSANAVNIGYPHFEEENVAVVVKQADGRKIPATLANKPEGQSTYLLSAESPLMRGDRICYTAQPTIHDDVIESPFLDNRLGCFALYEIAASIKSSNLRIILAATSGEEFTGFGASVLAAHCKPDLVICLDATYEEEEQNVIIGHGPVLTVTDKSVLLSQKTVESIKRHCTEWNIPLQTEIYNFSGTDARAFPSQGVAAPVLPILVPTTGNHTPLETAAMQDIEALNDLLFKLCTDKTAVASLLHDIASF